MKARMAPIAETSLKQTSAVKSAPRMDEFVGWLESEFRCGDAKLEVARRARADTASFRSRATAIRQFQRSSASEAVAAAAHEGDFAVAELVEMAQGEFGGALLVKDDVGDAFDFAVAGNDDCGEKPEALFESLCR